MRSDVYSQVTDRIITQLEQGVVPWKSPYFSKIGFPKNLASGKRYQGINVFLLASLRYTSPWFLTFLQAKELGGTVRKAEAFLETGTQPEPKTTAQKATPKPNKEAPPMTRSAVKIKQEFPPEAKSAPAQSAQYAVAGNGAINARIDPLITTALLRASVERRIQGVTPSTQRDIIAEALTAWLEKARIFFVTPGSHLRGNSPKFDCDFPVQSETGGSECRDRRKGQL